MRIELFLVMAFLPAVAALARGGEPPQRPLVGAIRWDAWYASGPVMSAVERSLGPHKYHFRLPFFARVDPPSGVKFNADAAAVMDTEISLAAHSGLDYWAFVDYWDDPSLTLAFRQYLASQRKGKMQFCFVEEGERLDKVGTNGWARLVRLFQDTNYVKVLEGHPLLFVYGRPRRLGQAEFRDLGSAATAAGLKKPYCVLMGWNPKADADEMQLLGFDAVSAYAAGGQYAGEMWSYEELTEHVRADYWEACSRLKVPTVTFATSGWDTRPRIEHPPEWCPWVEAKPDSTPPAEQKPLIDGVTASPQQLAKHLRDAIEWTRQHQFLNPANSMIVYAWNENDEGGWLIPTLRADGGMDTARLDAISEVLSHYQKVR